MIDTTRPTVEALIAQATDWAKRRDANPGEWIETPTTIIRSLAGTLGALLTERDELKTLHNHALVAYKLIEVERESARAQIAEALARYEAGRGESIRTVSIADDMYSILEEGASRAPQGAAEPKRPVLTEEQIKAAFWAGAKSFIRIDWDGPDDEVRIGRMWQDKRDALLAAGDIHADRKVAEQ